MRLALWTATLLGAAAWLTGCGASQLPPLAQAPQPCPDRPNCVSTQDENARRRVAPIEYHGSRENARKRIERIVSRMPRTAIVTTGEAYLQVTFRSALFRFVDDVEFWFPQDRPLILMRSASRTGYWDLGVNRRRIDKIRTLFSEEP